MVFAGQFVRQAASGPVLKAQHRRVKNALAHVLLAGVHQADKLQQAVDAQDDCEEQQVRARHTRSLGQRCSQRCTNGPLCLP